MNQHHRSFIMALFLLFLAVATQAQEHEIVEITGEAKVEFSEYKSLLEVKKEAQNAAIINALEKAFGVAIVEGSASYAKDVTSGDSFESSTVFNSIGNQWVNGDLIEILNSVFEEVTGTIIISDSEQMPYKQMKCSVRILAREINDNMVDFDAYPINCLNIHCKTNVFKAGTDDFYLYYKCPESGYLAIFLDDGKHAQRLFPYRNMGKQFEQGVFMEANKEYFLFSNEYPYRSFDTNVDEYAFEIEVPMEQDRLYVIFSYTPIVQPYIDNELNDKVLTEAEKRAGWKVPDALSSEEFLVWVNKNRSVNRNIKIKLEDIVIKKYH